MCLRNYSTLTALLTAIAADNMLIPLKEKWFSFSGFCKTQPVEIVCGMNLFYFAQAPANKSTCSLMQFRSNSMKHKSLVDFFFFHKELVL